MPADRKLSAQENAASFSNKKRTVALIIVALAFVMDLLDSTIVNVAIPSIRTNLQASFSAIQWVVAGYSLAFSILLVTGGRMGDVFGYKKLFMFGVAGFTVASLLSGVAQNPDMLIASRVLQGSMAAFMVPQVMSLMQVMYKPSERGKINGLFGALGGMAASLGPVVGGLLIKANFFGWDWRPIFLINIPIGIFGLIAAVKYLPNGKSSHPLKLDLFGTVLIMIAIMLLVYPLIQGRDLGWPLWTFIMMIASLPVFIFFAWWQRRKDKADGSPLVLPALFKTTTFNLGLIINLVFEMAIIGFFLTFTLLLQIGFGFSPIHAALTGLPVAFGIASTMAIFGEKVIPKLGRLSIILGSIIMAIGLSATTVVLRHYGLGIHSWQLLSGLLIIGIGMGFVFASMYAAVLNGADPKHAGSASGVLNAVQQVGSALGVALIGVIFFGQLSNAAPHSFATAAPQLQQTLSSDHVPFAEQPYIINGVQHCFVDRSKEKDSSVTPPSCKTTPAEAQQEKQFASAISVAAKEANSTNFNTAFKWGAYYSLFLLLFTVSMALFLPKKFRTDAFTEAA